MRTRHALLLPILGCHAVWGQAALRGLVDAHVHYNGDKAFLEKMALRLDPFDGTALILAQPNEIPDVLAAMKQHPHRFVGMGSIRLDDLNWERGGYNRWRAYGQSKLANLLFISELQRRLEAAGSDVRALAAHPGWAATNLQSRTENVVQNALMAVGNRVIAQSDEMGALPTLYAATRDLPGDSYVGPDGFREGRGYPTLVGRSDAAADGEVGERLWEVSEELTGVTFPLGPVAEVS
jgi:NAD(P)-dependent dehydrogenase (short-subunit alcohol dehydrogenase family)